MAVRMTEELSSGDEDEAPTKPWRARKKGQRWTAEENQQIQEVFAADIKAAVEAER